ncbi:hypothetical protein SINU_11780, partial [Sporolactobacillus inulinus CASD]
DGEGHQIPTLNFSNMCLDNGVHFRYFLFKFLFYQKIRKILFNNFQVSKQSAECLPIACGLSPMK